MIGFIRSDERANPNRCILPSHRIWTALLQTFVFGALSTSPLSVTSGSAIARCIRMSPLRASRCLRWTSSAIGEADISVLASRSNRVHAATLMRTLLFALRLLSAAVRAQLYYDEVRGSVSVSESEQIKREQSFSDLGHTRQLPGGAQAS